MRNLVSYLPMLGLLLDTSRKPIIIALIQEGKIIASYFLEEPKQLSSTLFPVLQNLLKDKIKNLAYISVGIGPGSYMGIRSAATIGKTLSFALNIPLIEFCSLLAFLPDNLMGPFTFVGDAKMNELYLVQGEVKGTKLLRLHPPKIIKMQEKQSDWIENPSPNLKWIAQHLHDKWSEKKISNNLELIYLR